MFWKKKAEPQPVPTPEEEKPFTLEDLEASLTDTVGDDGTLIVQVRQLRQWLLADAAFPSPGKVAEHLGLPAISDEGAQAEKAMAEKRMRCIKPMLGLISTYATINGDATAVQHLLSSKHDMTEESREQLAGVYAQVTYAGLIGFLSAFHHLGSVDVHPWLAEKE